MTRYNIREARIPGWYLCGGVLASGFYRQACGAGAAPQTSPGALSSERRPGVLALNAKLRRYVVPERSTKSKLTSKPHHTSSRQPPDLTPPNQQDQPRAPLSWAERLKRVFEFDITLCPNCGGRLRVIADVTDPTVIRRILDHVAAQPPLISQTATVLF